MQNILKEFFFYLFLVVKILLLITKKYLNIFLRYIWYNSFEKNMDHQTKQKLINLRRDIHQYPELGF